MMMVTVSLKVGVEGYWSHAEATKPPHFSSQLAYSCIVSNMSLRFVKTAVLTSTDGLDFSKEEAIESDEAKAVRLAQERAANKPLYQQLAEQKDKKQQEYDAMTKMIFAPPKAIDEEEAGFLRTLYEEKEDTERRKKEDELRQLEEFRAHRKSLDTGFANFSLFFKNLIFCSFLL